MINYFIYDLKRPSFYDKNDLSPGSFGRVDDAEIVPQDSPELK